MNEAKADLRRRVASLVPPRPGESEAVVGNLAGFLRSQAPSLVLFYLALADEVDLAALPGLVPDTRWAVTRVAGPHDLTIHPAETATEVGPLGIRQPPPGAPIVDVALIDVVLVPGRVFDRAGGRLGRGAGHYDRLLPSLRPSVPRVGVTLDRFVVERVPAEPHDVPVTHLATESGVTVMPPVPPAVPGPPASPPGG